VNEGDTFASLAKRYSASAASVSQVNHEALPEAGGLVAIPVGYPGDRSAPAKKAVASKHKSTGAPVAASIRQKTAPAKKPVQKTAAAPKPIAKTVAARKPAAKTPVRHTAALRTPNS